MSTTIPYPGLRPFRREETDIFFGREEHTDELLEKLDRTRFLAVVGPSGCGKSSLVRAGMLGALETGYMISAGSRWRIADMRPGSHPMKRLAEALMAESALAQERTKEVDAVAFLHATLRRGPLGLVEVLRETPLPAHTNLLLLVDQFEEIFRFRKEGDIDEADAFVALLLETAAQDEVPIYAVITMRSEYLGDCALFSGLPEAINESQYLTPRLTREQRRAAIVGPVKVFGGNIEPALINKLLNEMGANPDQLPLMQHLLMRMWTKKHPKVLKNKKGEKTPGPTLTLPDYNAAGGLTKALSNHADEAFEKLDSEQQRIAEVLFHCLSEKDTRRPVPLSEVAATANTPINEVKKVVEVFRHPDCRFITPPPVERLYRNTVLDVSHESLIRQWKKLKKWAGQEVRSAWSYRFLEQTARLWKAGKASLWGTPNLENALAWKEQEKPNATWAERYGGNFKLAMEFLDASEKVRIAKEAEEEAKRQHELQQARSLAEAQLQRAKLQSKINKWLRRVAIFLGASSLILGALILWQRDSYVWIHESYYNTYAKRNGLPIGIGKLSKHQVQKRTSSLRFIKKGRFGQLLRMEAVNSQGKLTTKHSVGTYFKPNPEQFSPKQECQWIFDLDPQGRIVYEKAYDKQGNLVWGFVYSPPLEGGEEEEEKERKAHFVGPDGYPRPQINSAANFVRFNYSNKGDETCIRYSDRSGKPLPGPKKAYGKEQGFDEQGLVTKMTSLGLDGKAMNDEFGKATLKMTYDELGNLVEADAYDASDNITMTKDGWAKVILKYDTAGNREEGAYFDTSGNATLHKAGYHRYIGKYDENGNIIEEIYFGVDGKPTLIVGEYGHWKGEYDNLGNLISGAYFDTEDKPVNISYGTHAYKYQYNKLGYLIRIAYYDVNENPVFSKDGHAGFTRKFDEKGNEIKVEYFGIDGKPTTGKNGYAGWKSEYDRRGNEIKVEYFGIDGMPATGKKGYAGWTSKYDDRGNKTETAYFGVDGNPITNIDGYALWKGKYDDYGNLIRVDYYDKKENPVLNKDGYAGWTSKYNDRGNKTETAYFGVDGNPITNIDGYALWKGKYDDYGNLIRVDYYDKKENPVLNKDGYAGWKSEYDRRGNEIKVEYFGIDGMPATGKKGYAGWTSKYDDRGNETETAYFGVDGNRIASKDGYARIVREFNEHRKVTEVRLFGPDGRPALLLGIGPNIIKYGYDDRGYKNEESYYSADGKPMLYFDEDNYKCARWVGEYNAAGKLIRKRYYDEKNKLIEQREFK